MIGAIPVPCKDCKNRHNGCHTDCQDYKSYKTKIQKVKDNIIDSAKVSQYFIDAARKRKERMDRLHW